MIQIEIPIGLILCGLFDIDTIHCATFKYKNNNNRHAVTIRSTAVEKGSHVVGIVGIGFGWGEKRKLSFYWISDGLSLLISCPTFDQKLRLTFFTYTVIK